MYKLTIYKGDVVLETDADFSSYDDALYYFLDSSIFYDEATKVVIEKLD
jgi:hypothetical protein